jgi:hypothetical protein
MMLSTTHRSRANTADTWYSLDRPMSREMMGDPMTRGLPSTILGMFKQDGLEDVEEASEEGDTTPETR